MSGFNMNCNRGKISNQRRHIYSVLRVEITFAEHRYVNVLNLVVQRK